MYNHIVINFNDNHQNLNTLYLSLSLFPQLRHIVSFTPQSCSSPCLLLPRPHFQRQDHTLQQLHQMLQHTIERHRKTTLLSNPIPRTQSNHAAVSSSLCTVYLSPLSSLHPLLHPRLHPLHTHIHTHIYMHAYIPSHILTRIHAIISVPFAAPSFPSAACQCHIIATGAREVTPVAEVRTIHHSLYRSSGLRNLRSGKKLRGWRPKKRESSSRPGIT
jgi:hypothetical protein